MTPAIMHTHRASGQAPVGPASAAGRRTGGAQEPMDDGMAAQEQLMKTVTRDPPSWSDRQYTLDPTHRMRRSATPIEAIARRFGAHSPSHLIAQTVHWQSVCSAVVETTAAALLPTRCGGEPEL